MRGSKDAFDALITKNADTLYFITTYNAQEEPVETKIYLGDMLVSSSSASINLSPAALEFLNALTQAVNNDEEDPEHQIQDGQFLIYDLENNTWIPASLENFSGATQNSAGTSGLVPAPQIGEQDKYLRGDGSWADLTDEVLPLVLQRILGDEDENINDSYDTIKEISDWILHHPDSVAEINNRLTNIENALGFVYQDIPVQATDPESEDGLAWEKDEQGNYILDENNNKIPIYETTLVQATDPESEDGLAWEKDEQGNYILDEYGNKTPIYETEEIEIPVQATDPDTGELLFDENNNPIYETEIVEIIDPDTGEPIINDETGEPVTEERIVTQTETIYVYETVTEKVLVENPLENFIHFQTVVGDLSSLLGYTSEPEPSLTIINNMSSNIGDLNDLLLKQEETMTDEGDPESLVDAINILDVRTRWQELTI